MPPKQIKRSKEFYNVCDELGHCTSREEENQLVSKWLGETKKNLSERDLDISKRYESIISLIHLSLLGYNTSFGIIHAISLTQDPFIMNKALGYIACGALLDSHSDFLILIINSCQRDLSNRENSAVWCLALTAICQLINVDLIPPILNYVGQALHHSSAQVRMKAVMCIRSFVRKDTNCVVEYIPDIFELVNDHDYSVKYAVVSTLKTFIEHRMCLQQCLDSVNAISKMLVKISRNDISSEYNHHGMLAPFFIINIFQFFQKMSAFTSYIVKAKSKVIEYYLQTIIPVNSASAAALYEVIGACSYEGIRNTPSFRTAVERITTSKNRNIQYCTHLLLIKIPKLAAEYQDLIIDGLENADPTLKFFSLQALNHHCNETNYQFILNQMFDLYASLSSAQNSKMRASLCIDIVQIGLKFLPTASSFAKTVEKLFLVNRPMVKPSVVYKMFIFIRSRTLSPPTQPEIGSVVDVYIDFFSARHRRMPHEYLVGVSDFLGISYHCEHEYSNEYTLLLLCDLADQYEAERPYFMVAILKGIGYIDRIPAPVIELFHHYTNSRDIYAQQLAHEGLALFPIIKSIKDVYTEFKPLETSLNFDFLDDFVQKAIADGAEQYVPIEERDDDDVPDPKKQIRFSAYTTETSYGHGLNQPTSFVYGPEAEELANQAAIANAASKEQADTLNTQGVVSVWGETGLVDGIEPETEADQQQEQQQQVAPIEVQPEIAPEESIFKKYAIQRSNKFLEEPSQREKLAAALFSKPKANEAPTALYVDDNSKLIEETVAKCLEQPSEAIAKFSVSELPQQCYQDRRIKVTCICHSGSVLLTILNTTNAPLMDLSIDIVGPEVLNQETSSHPNEPKLLPAGLPVFVLSSFKFPTKMKGFPEMKFSTHIGFEGEEIVFDLPMNLLSFIVPVQATTPQFGKVWKEGGSEITFVFPQARQFDLDEIHEELTQNVHLFSIQRIGLEEIFLGGLFSTPFQVLMHAKATPAKSEIKVMTKAQPLTQVLIESLKTVFGFQQ